MFQLPVKAFMNASFYTMREEGECFEALVTRGDRIWKLTTAEEAQEIAREHGGEVVDLKGCTVLPGFIDAHQHVQAYAGNLAKVNLREANSVEELKEKIRERAAVTPKGELIQGAGFDQERFPIPEIPTKEDLDEAAPDHPVLITRYCLHVNVANSKALAMTGIGSKADGDMESVEYREDGEPSGRMGELAATKVVNAAKSGDEYNKIKEMVAEALQEEVRYGITGIHPIQGKSVNLLESTRVYQDLRDEGRLPVRIYIGYDEFPPMGIRTGLGDEMVKFGFYKIYTDGSLGARSARFSQPYHDDPSQRGVMIHTQEGLNKLIATAYDRDIQIGIHAIGDEAVDMAVTALEESYYKNPKEDIRFRLIHASLVREDLIERMKKLPIMCDVQPTYVSTNISWSDSRVGERAGYLFAWKRLVDAGLVLTGSSDAPVEPINPLLGIYAAVTRKGYDEAPEGGWHPENKLTRFEAVSLYTKNGAYASFEENIKGTLEEGKLADFAVLDRDVFQVPENDIQRIKVVKTYLGAAETFSLE